MFVRPAGRTHSGVMGEKANIFKARYLYGNHGSICGGYKCEGECALPGEITVHVRPLQHGGAAPTLTTAKAPAMSEISGLNNTAFAIAVYASQAGAPQRRARLASGCRPSFSKRDWLPTGSHKKFSRNSTFHPPFPGLSWR